MKRIYKRSGKEKTLLVVYGVAIILLLSSYLITLYSNRKIIKQIDRVEHTNTVLSTLEGILSMVKDAETGLRGYVMTKDKRFLQPYYGSERKADSLCKQAKALTGDNPEQQERLL